MRDRPDHIFRLALIGAILVCQWYFLVEIPVVDISHIADDFIEVYYRSPGSVILIVDHIGWRRLFIFVELVSA